MRRSEPTLSANLRHSGDLPTRRNAYRRQISVRQAGAFGLLLLGSILPRGQPRLGCRGSGGLLTAAFGWTGSVSYGSCQEEMWPRVIAWYRIVGAVALHPEGIETNEGTRMSNLRLSEAWVVCVLQHGRRHATKHPCVLLFAPGHLSAMRTHFAAVGR